MPYISRAKRQEVINTLAPQTTGELNFLLTSLVDGFVQAHGGTCYETINAVVGVLECVKQEFYRRVAGPYEYDKMVENGDVYRSTRRSNR